MNGLFIDIDHALADNSSTMRTVYMQFMADLERGSNNSEFDELFGKNSLIDIVTILRNRHRIKTGVEVMGQHLQNLAEDYHMSCKPAPGCLQLLKAANRMWMPVVLVTSFHKDITRRWLSKYKLLHFFQLLITAEAVQLGKPSPEGYELALKRSGCSASGSVAVEGSVAGVLAASRAGLKTFYNGRVVSPRLDHCRYTKIENLAEVIPSLVMDKKSAAAFR